MPKDFKGQKSKVKTFFVADTNTQLKNIKDTVIEKSADVVLPKDGIVHANLAYFPTWHVSVDGKEISPQITPTGLDIPLSQGSHVLIIYYQETMIERVADMVSIIGIIAAIVAIMYQGRFTIHEKEKR